MSERFAMIHIGTLPQLHGLSGAAVRVYLALAAHADGKTGEAWPDWDALQDLAGCGRSTAADALGKLQEAGLLVKVRSGSGRRAAVWRVVGAAGMGPGSRTQAKADRVQDPGQKGPGSRKIGSRIPDDRVQDSGPQQHKEQHKEQHNNKKQGEAGSILQAAGVSGGGLALLLGLVGSGSVSVDRVREVCQAANGRGGGWIVSAIRGGWELGKPGQDVDDDASDPDALARVLGDDWPGSGVPGLVDDGEDGEDGPGWVHADELQF